MNSDSTPGKSTTSRKRKTSTPWGAAFDKEEIALLKGLQEATGDVLSISEIIRHSVRYSVPKFLSGEVPITKCLTVVRPVTPGSSSLAALTDEPAADRAQ